MDIDYTPHICFNLKCTRVQSVIKASIVLEQNILNI